MSKYCLIVFAVLFSIASYAQDATKFHRGYPIFPSNFLDPDTSIINLSGLQMKDETYISFDGMIPIGDSTVHYYLITNYGKKGDVNWTKKIQLGANLGQPGFCSIYQSSNDSLYFSVSTFDGNNKKLIGALAKNGNGLWMKAYNNDVTDEDFETTSNEIVEGKKDSLIHQFLNINDGENLTSVVNKLGRDGSLISSKSLAFSDTIGNDYTMNVADYVSAPDGFLATGAMGPADGNGFPIGTFSKFDLNDRIKFSKVYSSLDAEFLPIVVGLKVQQSGTDYVIAGQFIDLNFLDFQSSYFGSFLLKIDSIGNVKWSKVIDRNIAPFNIINGLTIKDNNDIIVAGEIPGENSFVPFIVSLESDGSQNWFNTYNKSSVDGSALGELFATKDKGYGFFHRDIEDASQGLTKTAFIKTDDKGQVGCDSVMDNTLFVDHRFVSDTIISTETPLKANMENLSPTVTAYSNFDIPILSLAIRPFCPNEVIDWTFDAKVKDAVSWKWSDKSTADTLRVMETGEYSVTVTIEGKYCFMLCDTATLERTDLPTVQALEGPKVCVGAPFIVTSSFTAASPVNSIWTFGGKVIGTNVGSVTGTELGTYTVKIIDQCGDTATSNIKIDDSIYLPNPSAAIAPGAQVCINKEFELTATGFGGGGGPYTFKWSQANETTSKILANKLGSYKVTVTDRCGLTAVAITTIDDNIWLPAPSAAIAPVQQVCKDAEFLLSAGATGQGPFTFLWSNGATGETLLAKTLGDYTVTVTDRCGLTSSAKVTVNSDIWLPPPSAAIALGPQVCKDTDFLLSAGATGQGPFTFLWNTGATTETLQAKTLGEYTVIVSDRCGLTSSAKVTVTSDIWFGPPKVEIERSSDNTFCQTGKLGLIALGSPSINSYTWSNGTNGSEILVDGDGTYIVTVTDKCGLTNTAEIKINNASAGSECMRYAKVFMPEAIDYTENRFFGAINQCGVDSSTVNNYKLNIYNRFGQEVFSTTNLTERWNGSSQDSTPYPPDVFVWYSSYSVGKFCNIVTKGDVTLFR
jgi:hypothetical protein